MRINPWLSIFPLQILLAQSPLEDLRAQFFAVIPEVRVVLALEVLAQSSDAKIRQETLDLLEATAPQLQLLYPPDVNRGSAVDRPSGFAGNAARHHITQAQAWAILAREYAPRDLDRAGDFLRRSHALFNQSLPCRERRAVVILDLPAAFDAYLRAALAADAKRRRAALDFAEVLLLQARHSGLSLALAGSWAKSGQPLERWLAAFVEQEDTNRSFFETWVFGLNADTLAPLEPSRSRHELLQALDQRLRRQLAKPLCSDHFENGRLPANTFRLLEAWRKEAGLLTEPYRWLEKSEESIREPLYNERGEASDIFELGRQMRHDTRLKPGAPTEEVQAALAETIIRAKRITAWPGDPNLPPSYLPVQKIYFLDALLYSLPPQEEFRFPLVDIMGTAYSAAFARRDAASIAVWMALGFLERLSTDPTANAAMLDKIIQMPDPNLRALASLVRFRKKVPAH